MEIKAILTDWTSYLNTKPKAVVVNCADIITTLRELYGEKAHLHVIGIGYSGATLGVGLLPSVRREGDKQGIC